MNFQEILLSVLGTILVGLASWGTTVLIGWINSKVKNKELAALLSTVTIVMNNAVKATYQSYVEALKGTDAWTKEAQQKALQMALETAKSELTTEALAYIEAQHGDIDAYLTTLAESILYDLKNGSKKVAVATEEK